MMRELSHMTDTQCLFSCGFPDASWFGCGGYQGDEGNADAQRHNKSVNLVDAGRVTGNTKNHKWSNQ